MDFTVDWIAKYSVAQNNLPLELDIGTDLAELKADLAKFKKGKHGKGLDDINIEELDWVSHNKYDFKASLLSRREHIYIFCNFC